MRGEPEEQTRFQRVMSLKEERRMLRMNDNPHEQSGATDAGRDGRVFDVEPACEGSGAGEGAGVPVYRAGIESPDVSSAEQRAEGYGQEVPGQSHRPEPGADDAPDSALDADAADREEACAAPELPATLYRGRCRISGGGGRCARGSFGPRRKAPLPQGMDGVRRQELRATGGHLGLAYLQPAPVGGVSENTGTGYAHAGTPGVHRGAPQAGPERQTRLSSGGHRAPGTPRRQARRVSHQRGRYGDTVAECRLRRDDQRAAPDSGAGGDPASVSLPDTGVSLRQRVGVSEPHSGQTSQQAAGGGVHQIACLPQHRQRAGGRKEWCGDTQTDRLRADQIGACRRVAGLLHGSVESVSELPPTVRLRQDRNQRARQTQAILPAQRLSNAVGEAEVAERLAWLPERRNHRSDADPAGAGKQRHRGSKENANGQTGAAGPLPEITGRQEKRQAQKRCGNDGQRETKENQNRVYLRFPQPLEITPRFPHSHTVGRGDSLFSHPVRSRPSDARNQQRPSRKELFAAFYPLPPSGSSRPGINLPFQAHRALELIFRFRLICGLENAEAELSSSTGYVPVRPNRTGDHRWHGATKLK